MSKELIMNKKQKIFKEKYNKYLKSKKWNGKRISVLKRDNYTCRDCGTKKALLDVHHITYDNIFCERLSDLKTLCRKCHNIEHNITSYVPNGYVTILVAVIAIIIIVVGVSYGK